MENSYTNDIIRILIVEDNFSSNFILYVGNIGLTVASIVTIYTGYIYFKRNLKLFK